MDTDDTKLSKALRKWLAEQSPKNGGVAKKPPAPFWGVTPAVNDAIQVLIEARAFTGDPDVESLASQRLLERYKTLLSFGLNESAAVLLSDDPELLSSLSSEDYAIIACAEIVIPKWIEARASGKEAKSAKELRQELIELALAKPGDAIGCALASWTCRAMDVKALRKLIPLVSVDVEAGSSRRLLDLVMLRDKDGDFTIRWLRDDPGRTADTSERILSNPKLMRHALGSASSWFRHPSSDVLVTLFKDLLRELPTSRQKKRADLSGRLLTLAGALVPVADKSEAAPELLRELQALGLSVWSDAADSEDRYRTWAFIQSGNRSLESDSDPGLKPDQAKQLCLAVLRARKGKDPLVELESACANLGASRFGECGEVIPYDATIHNDLDGGLLPGDQVTVVKQGLRFLNAGLVKADVQLSSNY